MHQNHLEVFLNHRLLSCILELYSVFCITALLLSCILRNRIRITALLLSCILRNRTLHSFLNFFLIGGKLLSNVVLIFCTAMHVSHGYTYAPLPFGASLPSTQPLLNRFPRAVFLEPYCEDHICKNNKLLTSTCTEAVEYRLWMKLSRPG